MARQWCGNCYKQPPREDIDYCLECYVKWLAEVGQEGGTRDERG